jgi:guanylate kinase
VRRLLKRRAVLVFLLPPSLEQLRQRLFRRRTDTPAAIRRRLAAARRELACAAWYDHVITNDRLTATVARVKTILRAGTPQRKG